MKVFLATPSTTFIKDPAVYHKIADAIMACGHTEALSVDDKTLIELADTNSFDEEDWITLCSRLIEGLKYSDAAIFDVTDKATFGIGYLAALALQDKKPTLLLLREGSRQGSMISGLQHPLLARRFFNESTAGDVIKEFLTEQIPKLELSIGVATW